MLQEAEGLRKHIEEFARCKDFWIQLLDQMTEYYRSSTHLQQAEASLARLLIVASNAEKEASAAAMASMAAAHKVRCIPIANRAMCSLCKESCWSWLGSRGVSSLNLQSVKTISLAIHGVSFLLRKEVNPKHLSA